MASPFPFESMRVFGWLASMLLIGVLLRARISFFQRFLFPGVADNFLEDLRQITPVVPSADSQDLSEQAAMYAMLGTMSDRSMARKFAVEYINNLYRVS